MSESALESNPKIARSARFFAKLAVIKGGVVVQEVSLNSLPVTIGRSKSADFYINDELASRAHCTLHERHGLLIVRDLGSSNGTLVNGVSVKEALLRPGDRLVVGKTEFLACLKHIGISDIPVTETEVGIKAHEPTVVGPSLEPGTPVPDDDAKTIRYLRSSPNP